MKITLHKASKPIKRNSDILLVLGDGRTLTTDMQDFLAWSFPHDVAALGRGIKEYPGHVHHWMNADGDVSIHWAKNLPNGNGTLKHTFGEVDGFDVDWDLEGRDYHYEEITGERGRMHGSSAMFATMAALAMGYQKIILAGCPLDTEGHYMWEQKVEGKYTPERLGPLWMGLDYMAWLDFAETEEAKKVKSMSGYTAKMVGKASKEWLNGNH